MKILKNLLHFIMFISAWCVTLLVIGLTIVLVGGNHVSFDTPQMNLTKEIGVVVYNDNFRQCDSCLLRKNVDNLWELYLEGTPEERGLCYAQLAGDLIREQEDVFIEQIHKVIESNTYISILQRAVKFFNKDLDEYFSDEYKKEIYGIATANSSDYDFIGASYERQLNYHAAHDIGHAMQQYMLVGCSSLAAWNDKTIDSCLIVGRNFDFYFGDRFSENKVVMFVHPTDGYSFASVCWPAFIGVASGMNEKGLTITINAAKGNIPIVARTPISILARQILQYASSIDEAYCIAQNTETFVSESLLIGSAIDKKAAIIEKSPTQTALYLVDESSLTCTNHYQSESFANDEANLENIATSDSKYRQERLEELLNYYQSISTSDIAQILRDRYGKGNRDIGIGNEKSINQFICHHSVIFKPDSLLMWVSTGKFQTGKYICYDLNKIFSSRDFSKEIASHELDIDADSASILDAQRKSLFVSQSEFINEKMSKNESIDNEYISTFVNNNPFYFHTYELLGDYYLSQNDKIAAKAEYKKALDCEISRTDKKAEIEHKYEKCN